MPSIVKIITPDELVAMHTGSLMARRKALLACEESISFSDRDASYQAAEDTIEFKDSKEWKLAYSQLKAELSKRENWPSKGEKKKARKLSSKL